MCSKLHAWANFDPIFVFCCSGTFRCLKLSFCTIVCSKWRICPKNCVQCYILGLILILFCLVMLRCLNLSFALLFCQKRLICPKNCIQIYMIRLILTLQNVFWGIQSTPGVSTHHQKLELVHNNQKSFHQIFSQKLVFYSISPNFPAKNWWNRVKDQFQKDKFDENSFGYFSLILTSDDRWRHLMYSEHLKFHFEGSELAGSCRFEHNF